MFNSFSIFIIGLLVCTSAYAGSTSSGSTMGMHSVSFSAQERSGNSSNGATLSSDKPEGLTYAEARILLDSLGLFHISPRDIKIKILGINPETGLLEIDLILDKEVLEVETAPELIAI